MLVSEPEKFVKETFVLPVLDKKTGFRVDFIFSFSEYERTALKRVKKIRIDKIEVNFASVEIDFKYILRCLEFFESILEEKLTQKFLDIKSEVGI
jgi:hypothetical protein